ncbi:PREDICTED: LOW QUALITY PROTEIN: uncharacterized protein LOC109468010 [Branchiostoma belcheri]|uniref:LOW QUALITY PROTEIN: uncharacterized protein LOC109468010 n=1 Tax=Branchiostoma belcheri TaxID=7741 RepID=A0A6P4YBE8_BRABE|nr:PREDICTED: LOW QUALITY PROTEIN: uncharacterized protein LOC109468010 [Branchiostoma belcheri]
MPRDTGQGEDKGQGDNTPRALLGKGEQGAEGTACRLQSSVTLDSSGELFIDEDMDVTTMNDTSQMGGNLDGTAEVTDKGQPPAGEMSASSTVMAFEGFFNIIDPIPADDRVQNSSMQATPSNRAAFKERPYEEYLNLGNRALENGDLNSAETNFAAALRLIHEPSKPVLHAEAHCLQRLGDVYKERGKRTKNGGVFNQSAALYNAALARTEDEESKQNLLRVRNEVEPLFLSHTANIGLEPTWHHVVIDHKKELDDMRRHMMHQLDAIHKEYNPYQYHEDDPAAREVETLRANAIRDLFKTVARDRQRLLQVLVEECITELGPPPCRYALIAVGSQAAELATLYSELDFAILIEEGKDHHDTQWYFRKLSWYLHLKVINLGETTLPSLAITSLNDYRNEDPTKNWFLDFVTPPGFAFDGYLTKNPPVTITNDTDTSPLGCLILTPTNMAELQHRCVLVREGHCLSDVLRRVAYLAGGQDLVDEYVNRLKSTPEPCERQARLLGRLSSPDEIHQIDTSLDKARLLNLKKDIYRFPSTVIEALGLVCDISSSSTWTVIEELKKQHHISDADANHLTVMTSISAEIQMREHATSGGRNESPSELLALPRQTKEQETYGTVLRSTFHIPHPKMLFRYYFTAIPLKRCVLDILEDTGPVKKGPLLRTAIFDSSSSCRAELARDLYLLSTSVNESESVLRVTYIQSQEQAISIAELAATRKQCGDLKEAIILYDKSLSLWKWISNTSVENRVIAQRHIANILNNLGLSWSEQGDDKQAIKFYEQAMEIRGKDIVHTQTAALLNNIALSWWKLGDESKATSFFEQCLVVLKSVHKTNVIHASIAACLFNLGVVWGKRGDHKKSMMYKKESLRMKQVLHGDNTAHPDIAALLHELGSSCCRLGDLVKGIRYFEQSIKVLRTVHKEKPHEEIVRGLNSLGSCWNKIGDYIKAICYVERSLEMNLALKGDTSHLTIVALHRKLGSLWSLQGNYLEAIKHLSKSLTMMTFLCGEKTAHPDIAALLNNLGVSWCKLGEQEKAMQNNQRLPEVIRRIYGAGTTPPSCLGGAYHTLQLDSAPHAGGSDHEKAMAYFEQSLKMRKTIHGATATHPDIASSLSNLGSVWSKLGDRTKAIQYKAKALSMRKDIHGDKPHPDTAALLNDLGVLLWQVGDKKKALCYFEQCLEMTRDIHKWNTEQHPAIAGALNNLAMSFKGLGNLRKAAQFFAESAAMMKAVCGEHTAHVNVTAPLINFGVTWDMLVEENKEQTIRGHGALTRMCIFGNIEPRHDIAMSLSDIGSSCFNAGLHSKARTYYEHSILILQAIYGYQTNNADVARLLGQVGLCCNELGEQTKAISYFERSLDMGRALPTGTKRLDSAVCLSKLASICCQLGNHNQAISHYEESLRIMEIVIGDNVAHPQTAATLSDLASTWSKVGNYRNAISCEEQSLKMKKTIYGDSTVHPDISASLGSLGLYRSKIGDQTKAIGYYEHLLGMLHTDNTRQPQVAAVLGNLGSSWSKLGDQRKAISFHEQALKILQNIHGRNRPHQDIATAFSNLGLCWGQHGERNKAIECYELALKVLKALYGDDAQHPHIAEALYHLGLQCSEIGHPLEAIMYQEQSLHMRRAIYKTVAHPDIAASLNSLGATWSKHGDQRKAIAFYEMSLQNIRALCGEDTVNPEIAKALSNLGKACTELGDHPIATEYYEQALQMQEAIHGENTPHPDVAYSLCNLASSWIKRGDQRKAMNYSEMLLAMIRTVEGEKMAHPGIAMALGNMGKFWTKLGDHEKAVKYYEDALKMRQRLCGESSARETATLLCDLGLSWSKLGDDRRAVTCFEQFLEMTKRIKGEITAHSGIAEILNYLGSTCTKLGDYGKAAGYYEQALAMLYNLHGSNALRPDMAAILNNLGSAWGKLGNQSKAISYMEMSLNMRQAMYGEDPHPDTARLTNNLGTAWCQLGDQRRAASYFEESLKMMKRIYGENTAHPDIVAALDNLGLSWGHIGDQAKSISYKEESLRMMKAIYGGRTTTSPVATSPDSLVP